MLPWLLKYKMVESVSIIQLRGKIQVKVNKGLEEKERLQIHLGNIPCAILQSFLHRLKK